MCPFPARSSDQQGFTLIEMLVAVSLLALLGLASALALNSALRSQTIMGTKQDALEQLQRSQRLLSRDLEQLLLRPSRDMSGNVLALELIALPQADDSNDGLILQFFKSGRRVLNPTSANSRLEHVRYRIEAGQLLRETTPLLDPSGSTPWHSAALLEGLTQLQLRFFYRQQWLSQWPPLNLAEGAGSGLLPAAIEIRWQTEQYAEVTQLVLIPGGTDAP